MNGRMFESLLLRILQAKHVSYNQHKVLSDASKSLVRFKVEDASHQSYKAPCSNFPATHGYKYPCSIDLAQDRPTWNERLMNLSKFFDFKRGVRVSRGLVFLHVVVTVKS